MPKLGDLHHCKECGPKHAKKRAMKGGVCIHKKTCYGTRGSKHGKHEAWVSYQGEACVVCGRKKAHQKTQQKREHNGNQQRKGRVDSWYHEKPGRKKPGTKR